MTQTDFGGSQFPDGKGGDGPQNVGLLTIKNPMRLPAREHFTHLQLSMMLYNILFIKENDTAVFSKPQCCHSGLLLLLQ